MAFIKIIFITFSSWGLSAFNFMPVDNASLNSLFYKKQIDWGVQKYLPELAGNASFQKHLKRFIEQEKPGLFLTPSRLNVFIPKYFFRFKAKDGLYNSFELGLIMADGSGSLWSKKGQVSGSSFYTNLKKIPKNCPLEASKVFLYAEYNKKTSICSSFFLNKNSAHPLYFFSITTLLSNNTNHTSFSPKNFYPGVITGGNTPVYQELRKHWRLVFSRVQNLKDHSIIYFP